MGNENNQQQQGTIVSVKRVRKGFDTKEREKIVLTFGPDSKGRDSALALARAIQALEGKQINFDIRLDKKESDNGTFDTAFVIVKEMVPKDQRKATFVPKNKSRADDVKAKAKKIQEQFD